MIIDFIIFILLFVMAFGIKAILNKWIWIIPISMIAGFIGLLGTEQIFNLYSFKGDMKLYIDISLAFIFATFPLTIKEINTEYVKKIIPLWKYSALQFFTQWGISLLLATLVIKYIWPITDDTFGLILPSGFAGGHGSAAIIGGLLDKLGHLDALTLAMSMATAGAFLSVTGGMLWVLWGHKKGYVKSADLKKQKSAFQFSKINFISILILITVITIAYIARPLIIALLGFDVPVFILAVIISFLTKFIFDRFYQFDMKTLAAIANISTDILVCIGIASIKILVVYKYMYPMLFIIFIALTICFLYFRFLLPKFFDEQWYEKGLFTWGWSVGGLAFGLALVRIVSDKERNTNLLQQFAMAYLLLSPLEISLLLTMPYLVHKGYALIIAIFLLLLAFIIVKSQLKSTDK